MTQATSGIANLIERIKQDGVQAGERERDARIENAEQTAKGIVAAAREEASRLRAEALAENTARRGQLEAELRMAARDFAFRMQERIGSQVIELVAADVAAGALADHAAVTQLVLGLLAGNADQGAEIHANAGLRDKLAAALGARVALAVDAGGVALVDDAGLVGFRLKRAGQHFVWDVSEEAVARELARLVAPGLRATLAPDRPKPGSGAFAVAPAAAEKAGAAAAGA